MTPLDPDAPLPTWWPTAGQERDPERVDVPPIRPFSGAGARRSRAGPTARQGVPGGPGALGTQRGVGSRVGRDLARGIGFGLTERRRSRTDLAVGCTTVRVLKTRWATGPGRSAASVAR